MKTAIEPDAGAPPTPAAASVPRWPERALYWLPVFVLMVLFAEFAFLGLRPALAEGRRLDVAEAALADRLAEAQHKQQTLALQIAARRDPIYAERLRRLRTHPPLGN